MEKSKHPACFLQDVRHLPRLPGGDIQWPRSDLTPGRFLQEAAGGLPAEFSAILHMVVQRLPHARHGAGALWGMSSLALVAPVTSFCSGWGVLSGASGTCGSKHM